MNELDRLLAQAREVEPPDVPPAEVDWAVDRALMTGHARHRGWVRRRVMLASGVGAALAAAAVLLVYLPTDTTPRTAEAPADAVPAENPPRERTDLELPTGDRLMAAEGARFRVALSTEAERRIELVAGAMLFDVRPLDGGRFRVLTPAAEIRVTGTVFTVVAEPDATLVRVYEGSVEVTHDGQHQVVRRGESARIGEPAEEPDPLAAEARRAAQRRPAPVARPTRREREPRRPAREPSASEVRSMIGRGGAQRALELARGHVDRGELDPWLLLEADALRGLGRRSEAADAYGRAAAALPSPRREQAGFQSARLHSAPDLGLRALEAGEVTAMGSPLRERGLALRADLLGRLGRADEREATAREYLRSYPDGSRVPAMRELVGRTPTP